MNKALLALVLAALGAAMPVTSGGLSVQSDVWKRDGTLKSASNVHPNRIRGGNSEIDPDAFLKRDGDTEFDPDAFLKRDGDTEFDPDAFLKRDGDTEFDPDAFLKRDGDTEFDPDAFL